jgi:spore maturation protein CgeB
LRKRIHIFAHSLISDWNHGNAHFLRGLARDLGRMGHEVRCHEELGSWSLSNLVKSEQHKSITTIDNFRNAFPDLRIFFYQIDNTLESHLRAQLRNADVVLIHEWNDPRLVNAVLALKGQLGFCALLHDTHHRAQSRPGELLRFHMHLFDGVLAFGEALAKIYRDGFGMRNVWTFHEAADVETFRPMQSAKENDVLWIGNWGDEERTKELQEFLVRPALAMPENKFVAYGVRYPEEARATLRNAGIDYRGYLPNLEAPQAYADSKLALHLPRSPYANALGGIPTIRVFEALACGATLLCSPWDDSEKLFRAGEDFVSLADGDAMQEEMVRLLRDDAGRRQIAESGLKTVLQRHTTVHRAEQLTEIMDALKKVVAA